MQASENEKATIELRLDNFAQLFQLDSVAVRKDTLTADAEDLIVRKAKQFPSHQPIRITIELSHHIDNNHVDVGSALRRHFQERADEQSQDLRELFRYGRKALLIGVATLSICLFSAWHLSQTVPMRPTIRLFQESFVILGWVSMWKPTELFLYEWLPFARRRAIFTRLAHAAVLVERQESAHQDHSAFGTSA
jgi:hypothetical protein